MKSLLAASFLLSFLNGVAEAQFFATINRQPQTYNTTVFNCPVWAASGGIVNGTSCEATVGSFSSSYFVITGEAGQGLSGNLATILPSACNHCSGAIIAQTAVNVQKFSTTFQFVFNGWNFSLVLNNNTNLSDSGGDPQEYTQGAGCEGGFFQGSSGSGIDPTNNYFALEFDGYSSGTAGGGGNGQNNNYTFAQIYQGKYAYNAPNPPGQNPCNPPLSPPDGSGGPTSNSSVYRSINKVSTYPVPLNTPCTVGNCATFNNYMGVDVGTGHTYQSTVTYDGSNVTVTLFDVTASGTCTPVTSGSCFTYTWTNVDIPGMVGGKTTAFAGLIGSTANGNSTFVTNVGPWTWLTP